jgi:hypothetical protein
MSSRALAPVSSASKTSVPSSPPPAAMFLKFRFPIALSLLHGMLIGHEREGDYLGIARHGCENAYGEAGSGAIARRALSGHN